METEEERQIRRKKRIEEMKREKRKAEFMQRWGIAAALAAVLVVLGAGIGSAVFSRKDESSQEQGSERGIGLVELQDAASGGSETLNGGGVGPDGIGDEAGLTADNREGMFSEEGEREGTVPAGGAESSTSEAGAADEEQRVAGSKHTDESGTADGGDGREAETSGRRKGNQMARKTVDFPEGPETMPMSEPGDTLPAEEMPNDTLAGKTLYFEAHDSENTVEFDETIISQYGILIDTEDGTVLAQKEAHERMNPASMTKVLTLLVAAEHLTEADLDVTVSITIDITDYCYVNECSVTGYDLDEEVPVRDLLYGTILPSGADSSLALAKYVSGSHEAFVELMNEKVAELGLAESTHFTNCVGLYDEAHYTTAYDMAVIMKAAADDAFCREILSARTYTTTFTEQHPEGLVISNWFLRRIEDKDTHGEILCGKTGFVDQSGSCAASLAVGNDGKEYLCVTGNSTSSWKCIADQVALYQNFIPE